MLVCFTLPVGAEEPNSAGKAFAEAVKILEKKMGPETEFRQPPGMDDVEANRAYQAIGTTIAQLGTSSFPSKGYETFDEVCGALNKLSVRTQFAGGAYLSKYRNDPSEASRQLAIHFDSNLVKYQDRFSILIPSNYHCMAIHIPFFEKFFDTLPKEQLTAIRLEAVRGMRKDQSGMLISAASAAVDKRLSPANRALFMKAAADNAPAFARIMSVEERRATTLRIGQVAPGLLKSYPKETSALVKALSNTECHSLCKL